MIDEELKEVEVTLDEEKEEQTNQNPIEEAVNAQQLGDEGDSSENAESEKPALESELSNLKSEIEEIKKEPYSERVKKRIAKEVAKTRAASEKAKMLEERLARIESSMAEKEKEEEENQYKSVAQQLKEAIESGETEKQVELMEAMSDLRNRKSPKIQQPEPQQASETPRTEVPELAKDWIVKHNNWWNKPGFSVQTSVAFGIDKDLTDEGYDINDPEYYSEMDKRLSKYFPDLINPQETADKNTSQEEKKVVSSEQKRVQSPVAGVSRSTSGSAKSVKLSAEDLSNARKFGIDISDPAALKRYARELASLSIQDK